MLTPNDLLRPPPPVAVDTAGTLLARTIEKYDAAPLGPELGARGLGAYRGYAELLRHVARLADAGFRLTTIGKSVEGDPLFALVLGEEPHGRLGRSSVILSGVHPMEWIGVETHLRLLDRLAGSDLGGRSLVSIPVVNPDGLRRVEKGLRAQAYRFIRHNARGVDLNRNFDTRWGRLGFVPRLLGGVFFPGASPASEPEVQAVGHFLADVRVDRALSLHSFGGAVLFPSAAHTARVHDYAEHQAWATRIARAIDPARPYRAEPCARWARGITAGGLELDWFHERHGALSLLVECSRGGRGPSKDRLFDPFAWFNPPGLAHDTQAIAAAVAPFVLGLDP